MTREERLQNWVDSLSIEDLNYLCFTLTDRLIETEEICFYENDKDPYWDANGEPIISSEDF